MKHAIKFVVRNTNFINLLGIFNNFRDVWQTMFHAKFESSFQSFDIADKKKYVSNIFFFFWRLHLCHISSKSAIHTSLCSSIC